MSCYVVAFEVPTDAARQQLTTKLKGFGAYCPVTEHCWAILSDKSATQIRDSLTANLPEGSRIFVVRSGTAAAWKNSFGPPNDEWLKKNL